MDELIKTRNLEKLLDEAESRAAAVTGLVALISYETQNDVTRYVSKTSSDKTFKDAIANLESLGRIGDVALSLSTVADDVYRLVAQASMVARPVPDASELSEALDDVLDSVFNAGQRYAKDRASGKEIDSDKLDREALASREHIMTLFNVKGN